MAIFKLKNPKMITKTLIFLFLISLVGMHWAVASTNLSCENPLVAAKVIGDVVDFFVPSVNISVSYGSKHVEDGIELKPSMAVNPPTVNISGCQDDFYTLVMTDPDVPGPSNPTLGEFLHWVVINIPGGTGPYKGHKLVSYFKPGPPEGIHRYIFVLFHQKGKFPPTAVEAPKSRFNFKTRSFAARYDLGLPVAAIYFRAQKELAPAPAPLP